MAKCIICQSELVDKIDKQINNGTDYQYLVEWCKNRGLDVTIKSLKNHAKNHIKANSTNELKHSVVAEITNFSTYIDSIGMSEDDFKNLDTNIENVIYGAQKALSMLFFKNCAIADNKLDLHSVDEASYPSEQMRGLRNVYEMFSKVTGIQQRIDENTAIKTLEGLGYKVSKDFIDVEVDVDVED